MTAPTRCKKNRCAKSKQRKVLSKAWSKRTAKQSVFMRVGRNRQRVKRSNLWKDIALLAAEAKKLGEGYKISFLIENIT